MPLPAPDLIFDFERVDAAVKMVEAAIAEAQRASQEENSDARKAARAAGLPLGQSHLDDPANERLADALFDAALVFPRILRGALLIAIASHVEYALTKWCERLHMEWPSGEPWHRHWKPTAERDGFWDALLAHVGLMRRRRSEKRSQTLERQMLYLVEEVGMDLGNFKGWVEWKPIDGYRMARNCLAHGGGAIEPEHRKALTGLPHVHVEEWSLLNTYGPSLFIDAGACEEAVRAADRFFKKLTAVCRRDPRAKM